MYVNTEFSLGKALEEDSTAEGKQQQAWDQGPPQRCSQIVHHRRWLAASMGVYSPISAFHPLLTNVPARGGCPGCKNKDAKNNQP